MSLPEVGFGAPAQRWFEANFDAPTPVQHEGWARIADGEHALLVAPTGSGKTLAAFLYWIDRLSRRNEEAEPGVSVLYVSPLKALVYDIERNLRAPLIGLARAAETQGEAFRTPRVAVRTGDTSPKERRIQARDPAEILVTTPEALYLLLGSRARETLRHVEAVIVDEIHALAPTKRGAHLALSLERLAALTGSDPQRIGLSATARPLEQIARYLGGDRPVSLVETRQPPRLELTVSVPVPDMTRPDVIPTAPPSDAERDHEAGDLVDEDTIDEEEPFDAEAAGAAPIREGSVLGSLLARDRPPPPVSLWPALYPKLVEAIRAHHSAIVFVNSRGLCEKLAQRLNELAEEDLVRAHHGSIAHDKRKEIEEALKSGALRGIVATSSLELGIDMGAVDLVLMVESPGAVARGLQRVGRAGHQVGATSIGHIYPKHRGDLLEATVVADGMRRGEVEAVTVPRNPLDVLAQQIVAMVGQEMWAVDALHDVVRRTASFRELSRELLDSVLDMLAGRYPSTDFSALRPRLTWDRSGDTLEARPGAARLAILSGGTIPDRGLYAVHLGPEGPRIGELDEEMVHETRPGETVTLGASTWRVTEITRDRVAVVPAPGEPGKLPFWRGEGPGRPIELGRRLGQFVHALADICHRDGREAGERWLRETHQLDAWAAGNLVRYVLEQEETTGGLPTDRAITVERFRDELGDWRVCILSPFGARVHAPWALAIESRLSTEAGFEVQALWSDDGIVLRFADAERTPPLESLLPDPEEVEDLVVAQLAGSSLFAAQFRENAARALLLPRRRPGSRTPLWTQRLRAQNLLAVARGYPAFPIMLETYRSCLQDVFDLPSLRTLLGAVRQRAIRVDEVETRSASPFARSLVFAYTATYLYQGDVPLAERRAQALSLDRQMLRELLGDEELRDLLDAGVIADVEALLQLRAEDRRIADVEGLHDLLRVLGDLSADEIADRSSADPAPWIEALLGRRRIARMRIGGEDRLVAAEDVALYRDALGAVPPGGLPDALLVATERPLEQILLRYARQHGPFLTRDVAQRYAMLPAQLDPIFESLVERGRLLSGEFHPEGLEREWCEPEVLRRLRRHTLAKLRGEVAPVEGAVLGRFLAEWHGVSRPLRGETRLDEALDQLEGLPVSFGELEEAILPSRVEGFDPRQLDERGALGQLVWIGCGTLGPRDGRVALFRREHVPQLVEPAERPDDLEPLHLTLLDTLARQGASFFHDLTRAAVDASEKEVFDALWDLVWRGLVTNDTFAPLRALGRSSASGRARSARRRPRRPRLPGAAAAPPASAGRWSLVSQLIGEPVSPTERAHARAHGLLERFGILSRDAMALENLGGGFSAVYPVLRAMEEAGKIRRGHFVEGYSGAQFAYAAAVDLLRAARHREAPAQAIALAASDPANPYGALLPWPEAKDDQAKPRRMTGATVVLVAGELLLHASKGGRTVSTFPTQEPAHEEEARLAAALALARALLPRQRKVLQIETIDGEPAATSAIGEVFRRAGWRRAYRGLEFDRQCLSAAEEG